MGENHLSLGEAAEQLDISERTARRWIKAGKLRAYKPGRDYRIPERAVTELIEESEVRPKAQGRSLLEPSFNDVLEEERHRAEIDSSKRYARRRAGWYEQQLREAKQGGTYAGAKGLRALFSTLCTEYDHLGTRLVHDVHRRLQDMGEPTTADRLTAALEGVLDPMGEMWDALYTAATDAAETEADRDQLKKLRESPEELAHKVQKLSA